MLVTRSHAPAWKRVYRRARPQEHSGEAIAHGRRIRRALKNTEGIQGVRRSARLGAQKGNKSQVAALLCTHILRMI